MSVILLENAKEELVRPCLMKDGQIGVIVRCNTTKYVGRIVQRSGDSLISIGKRHDNYWDNLKDLKHDFLVRILLNGTKLEIVDNE